MKLVFATNNPHKLQEVQEMLDGSFELLSLADINCYEEIPETQDAIEGNALQKAQYIYQNYGYNCFADDTGLEVEALDGAPGVYSARYAGDTKNDQANRHKLLEQLQGESKPKAQFRTVIALIIDGQESLHEGIVQGVILKEARGTAGFGYDPIFQPENYIQSFAEMSAAQKNSISHRAKATEKLIAHLKAMHQC